MRILVTMRSCNSSSYPELRDGISHDWVKFLENFPITPIFIPNTIIDPIDYFHSVAASGLILTGGDDINTHYPIRDRTERMLMDEAIAQNVPILGVCRGLQFINQYFLGRQLEIKELQHINTKHSVVLSETICNFPQGTQLIVNSYHKYGVTNETVSKELIPFAISQDGIIEGLRHQHLNIRALQWHPERDNLVEDEFTSQFMKEWLSLCV